LAVCLLLAGLCTIAAAQKRHDPSLGRAVLYPATEDGNWDGTWLYVSRDLKLVIWMRTDEQGAPQMRWQYQAMANAEMFLTDWDGKVEYNWRNAKGQVDLRTSKRTADRIEGAFAWELDAGRAYRTVTGEYEIFRITDGRFFMLHFPNWKRVVVEGDETKTVEAVQVWTFKKISKRLIRWEEIPF